MKRNADLHRSHRLGSALRQALTGGALLLAAGSAWAEDAQEYFDAGKAAWSKGDLRTAVIQLKNSLQEDGEFSQSRLLLGQVYLRLNDPVSAEKELRRAKDLGAPKDAWAAPLGKALLMQAKTDDILRLLVVDARDGATVKADILSMHGSALMVKGERAEAHKKMLEALALNPAGVEQNLALARLALVERDLPKAKEFVDTALKTDPKSMDGRLSQGDVLSKLGQLKEAKAAFQAAVDQEPDNVFARLGRADVAIDLNEFESAANDTGFVLQKFPTYPLANYLRGKLLFKQQKFDQALESLQQVVKLEPNHVFSHLLLGFIYYQKKQFEAAEKSLKLFTNVVPNHQPSLRVLAATYMGLKEADKAVAILEKLVEQAPADPQLLAMLAGAHMEAKHHDKASQYLQRAVELQPDASKLRTQLALVQLQTGNSDQALANLQQAVTVDPNLIQADVMLVAALVQQGKLAEALKSAQALVQRDAKNPIAHNLLGLTYMATKEKDKARTAFNTALEQDPEFFAGGMNLVRMDLADKQFDAAQTRLDKLLAKAPDNADAILARYFLLDQLGKRDEAQAWLDESWAKHPSLTVGLTLFNAYMTKKEHLKALAVANEMQAKFPNNAESYRALGMVFMASGKSPSAVANFRKALEMQPGNVGNLQLLAMALRVGGELEASRKTYEEMLTLDGKNMTALVGKAEIELQLKNWAGVQALADTLKKDFPKLPIGHEVEGDSWAAQNQLDKAEKAYQEGIKNGSATRVVQALADIQARSGRADQAAATFEAWLKQHPDDSRARFGYGSMLQQMNKLGEAAAVYIQVMDKEPKNLVVLNNLVWILQQTGDGRAKAYTDKLAELNPGQPEIQDTLGWVLVQQNDAKRGLPYLEKAAEAAPKVPEIRYHLAAAYEQLGRAKEAKSLLDTVLAEARNFDGRREAENLQRKLTAVQ
ncbi:MAG: PEP-CTERM system TPR-repeat protein PrsT [Gammaproteobacteria bacterium]|nr:PEP-CTERM system TPR-repeat protein PrsT [Gammaproteobacteria bacterium]